MNIPSQGLLEQGIPMQAPQGMPQGQGLPQGQGMPPKAGASHMDNRDYDSDPPNEQDEALLDRMTTRGMKLVHSPESKKAVLHLIQQSEHPIEGIANVATLLMERIENQHDEEGDPLNDLVRLQGGNILVGEIISLAEGMEVVPPMDEKEKEIALAQAVQEYVKKEISMGHRDPQQLEQQMMKAQQAMGQGEAPQTAPQGMPQAAPQEAPTTKNDPFNPTSTMTEKLAGGLL